METSHNPTSLAISAIGPAPKSPKIPLRYIIIAMLFFMTTINNSDRAALGTAGPALSKDLGLDPAQLGILLSAFGWSYVVAQLPGGWLLDRFGSYKVYAWCIFLWSLMTLLQGFVGFFHGAEAIFGLFVLRLLVGLAEAPSFPANGRIVAGWFPTKERGTASAIFNSAQYFATVLFAPLMGWIIHVFGWRYVFWVMGGLGLAILLPWLKLVRAPSDHPLMTPPEFAVIEEGGALVSMDTRPKGKTIRHFRWYAVKKLLVRSRRFYRSGLLGLFRQWFRRSAVRKLLSSRMMIGVYIGQYCIATITAFFLTWFITYLVKQRHMDILNAGFVAVLPALCGFFGGVLGGVFSDFLLRRGYSLTFARKFPIVAGMLLSCVIVTCNYINTTWLVVLFMSLAFFGKGIGALGWTVVSDTAPKQVMGTCGALFNMFGNISTITTPIAIGYIVKYTGGFNGALVFVGIHAVGAILAYLLVVGEIKRLELKTDFAVVPTA